VLIHKRDRHPTTAADDMAGYEGLSQFNELNLTAVMERIGTTGATAAASANAVIIPSFCLSDGVV